MSLMAWQIVFLRSWCIYSVTTMMNFLVFGLCSRIIEFARNWKKKIAGYVNRNNFDQNAVPIARRNATISLDKSKTVNAKRNDFPLLAANTLTIHNAQEGTFGKVVYHHKREHCNKLVYLDLSRLTSLERLYILPENKVQRFTTDWVNHMIIQTRVVAADKS